MKDEIAETPPPPYYAVVFTSIRCHSDTEDGYAAMAEKMVESASKQPGFLGVETARSGLGITVSYWSDLESIRRWKDHEEHREARQKGRDAWYHAFRVRIARVEKEYRFLQNKPL